MSATIPNLIAPDIVSMQPMLSRIGEMRYLKVLYGSNKGSIKAGDTMFSQFQGGNGSTNYSSSLVESEYHAAAGTKLTGNLAWLPVIPGQVQLVVGATTVQDDGKGNIVGTGITGTINYNSGAFDITFTTAPADPSHIFFNYTYNNIDAPVSAPEVNLKIETTPVIAQSRKLKALYSFDAALTTMSSAA